jgi:hypothetical protein
LTVEEANADITCLSEERGPEALLDRYGITVDDIEHLATICKDDLMKTTVLLHGVLVGLALSELREAV